MEFKVQKCYKGNAYVTEIGKEPEKDTFHPLVVVMLVLSSFSHSEQDTSSHFTALPQSIRHRNAHCSSGGGQRGGQEVKTGNNPLNP